MARSFPTAVRGICSQEVGLSISTPQSQSVNFATDEGRITVSRVHSVKRKSNTTTATLRGKEALAKRTSPNHCFTRSRFSSSFPKLAQKDGNQARLVDRAFGVGEISSQVVPQSYVLGLARINEFYQQKKYEDALVEIDHLLTAYPSSPKLYKMKGTVLVRIQDYTLAEKAWSRALELDPADRTLQKALERLRTKETAH